jgi:alcohol dehydrogenase class IV
MNYTYFSPQQIVFGWGRRSELPKLAAALGGRVFLVSGSRTLERTGVIPQITGSLAHAGLTVISLCAPAHEPEVADVDAMTADLLTHRPGEGDVVIAIGGGSTVDLAKAVAAMATNRQGSSVVDFLEGVGRGLTIDYAPLPIIAVPTTAGTGAEATKNAVISSYDPPFKKSLRSDKMIPRAVLVDPELIVSVPPLITAYTGMDAITQLIESYISRRAAPIPRALCEQGLELALPALRIAVNDGSNRAAREAMSHAALLSGLALANSGLGLAHGVAAALGSQRKTPHGLACAVMLPIAMRVNLRTSGSQFARLARRCLPGEWQSDAAAAAALIVEIESLCRDVGIPPRLRDLGVTREQIPPLVIGSHGNSLGGNPRELSDAELTEILEAAW